MTITAVGPGAIRSAMLCITARIAGLSGALPKEPRRYETKYHDTGDLSGFSLFEVVQEPINASALKPQAVFVRLEDGRADVRVLLDESVALGAFSSRDFDGWDQSVHSVLQVAVGRTIDADWKSFTGSVLVLEDAQHDRLPGDPHDVNEYVRQWLQALGRLDTVAFPSRIEDTILISAPHVMANRATDRAVCVLTRLHPPTITAPDFSIAHNVAALLDCWYESIRVEEISRELRKDPFHRAALQQYLESISWFKSRRGRLVAYESEFLRDRVRSIDLVARARLAIADAERELRFNPWRKVAEHTTTLPLGKASHVAYPVAAVVASNIDGPFKAVSASLITIETTREGVSDHLRDAAAVHSERANWKLQMMVLWLTIATIVFGAGSLYFDWLDYRLNQRDAAAAGVTNRPFVPNPPTPPAEETVDVPPLASGLPPTDECSPQPSFERADFASTGGRGSFRVDAPDTCRWSVSSGTPWIRIGTAYRFGSGIVDYIVLPNNAPRSRSAVIVVGDYPHHITQDALPLTPSAQ
jgi:hypothetical protein